jgi:general secretion pathway protein A
MAAANRAPEAKSLKPGACFAVILFRVVNPADPIVEPSPAEKFFGLAARPFSLTPDLRFAYHSRSHTHALEQVTSALRRREGLIVVTGPVGTGKTMLCRTMLETFESRTFLSVILDPGLDVEDLLRQVLSDFGIINSVDAPASGPMSDVTRHQYVTTLQQFLASLIPLQAHAVIMIDEAQRLNPRVLEEIRLLSNFEIDEAKLLQIVLVGQPELDDLLNHPKMQQLNQRVARRCELQPLSESEVGDYIERRLTVAASPAALAGGADAGITDTANVVRFSPAAVKTVAGISGGIPRIVNTLCDRALEAAYEQQTRVVDPDAVIEAAQRLHIDVPGGLLSLPVGHRRTGIFAAAAMLVLLGAGGAWWWLSRADTAPAAHPAAITPKPTPSDGGSPAPPGAAPGSATDRAPQVSAGASSTGGATGAIPSSPAATPATGQAPAGAGAAVAAPAGTFQIAVAAFRTESRAQEVAASVSAMQIPAAVRLDSTGTWYRVVGGPFATREAAQTAQDALARSGYDGTTISQVSSEPR